MITDKQKSVLKRIKNDFYTINDFDNDSRIWIKELIEKNIIKVGNIRNYLEIAETNFNLLMNNENIIIKTNKVEKVEVNYFTVYWFFRFHKNIKYITVEPDCNYFLRFCIKRNHYRVYVKLDNSINITNIENQIEKYIRENYAGAKDYEIRFKQAERLM
jgi:hypothetical protein